ncbi:MAG: TerB family tellurite resistance protein [Parvularculaceae bacterium]
MFDRIKSLLAGDAGNHHSDEDDALVAVAALLVEAARSDQEYTDKERGLIDAALVDFFGVAKEDVARIHDEADKRQADATDIQRFTKLAKTLPQEKKISLLECLWRIILSDGERDAFEDSLIRRICGLIYVSDVESGAARRRVEREA